MAKAVIIIVLAIIAFVIWANMAAKANFADRYNRLEKIQNDVLIPLGAVEDKKAADLRGNGLLSNLECLPDVACPLVKRSWYVPVAPGKEREFLSTFLQSKGYRVKDISRNCAPVDPYTCRPFVDVVTGSTIFTVILLHIDLNTGRVDEMPQRDISPKVWRCISIQEK